MREAGSGNTKTGLGHGLKGGILRPVQGIKVGPRFSAKPLRVVHGEHWHAWLGDPTLADAILDRLMQHCRRFTLEGESRRTGRNAGVASKTKKTTQEAKS